VLTLEWTDGSGGPQSIDFDASERETYEGAAEVTEHVVEEGAAIADHVRAGNETATFEAWVSNTPITVPSTQMDGTTGSLRALEVRVGTQSFSAVTLQFGGAFDRVRAVDALLRALKDAGQRLTVVSGFRTIESCVIERYHVDRDAESGTALHLSLDVKKVRVVTTQTVCVPPVPARRRGQRQQNRGAQPTQAPPDRRGFALRALQALGGGSLPSFLQGPATTGGR